MSDKEVVVLNEAVPNPFDEQTQITFNIPHNATSAQMIFHDKDGKLIKTVEIRTKGRGQLNIYANDLSSGAYSYTLIVDNKVVDTKKFIKQ